MQLLMIREPLPETSRLQRWLASAGLNLTRVQNLDDAVLLLRMRAFDGVFMELTHSGSVVPDIKTIARHFPNLAIMLASPETTPLVRSQHLAAGADDHFDAKVDRDEVVSRVIAIVRRRYGHAASVIRSCGLTVDLEARTVIVSGVQLRLSRSEYLILEGFALRRGALLTREAILDMLETENRDYSTGGVEGIMHRIRQKLRANTRSNIAIVADKSGGYALVGHVSGADFPETFRARRAH